MQIIQTLLSKSITTWKFMLNSIEVRKRTQNIFLKADKSHLFRASSNVVLHHNSGRYEYYLYAFGN